MGMVAIYSNSCLNLYMKRKRINKPSRKKTTHNKLLYFSIGVGCIFALILTATYYAGTQVGKSVVRSQIIISQPKPTAIPFFKPDVDPSETINWKTFNASTLGITFKYPQTWKIESLCQSCNENEINELADQQYIHPLNTRYPLGINLSMKPKEYSVPLSYYLDVLKKENLEGKTLRQLSIDGYTGLESLGYDEIDKGVVALAVFENEKYIFHFSSTSEYIDIYHMILSTISFK